MVTGLWQLLPVSSITATIHLALSSPLTRGYIPLISLYTEVTDQGIFLYTEVIGQGIFLYTEIIDQGIFLYAEVRVVT